MLPERRAKRPTPEVRLWLTPYLLVAKNLHLTGFNPDDLVRLCGTLALVGAPIDNSETFYAFQTLFFEDGRTARWSEALDVIGADATLVQRITDCVMAFQQNSAIPLNKYKFNLPQVLGVMVQIAAPASYVAWVYQQGFVQPGGIFHPNTFEHAKGELRGAIGDLAREGVNDAIAARVDTVEI